MNISVLKLMIVALSLVNALMASPTIIIKTKQSHHQIDLEHDSKMDLNDIVAKMRSEQPAALDTFQIFAMYDKRGPWQPSFLPQPPPQAQPSLKVEPTALIPPGKPNLDSV